MVQKVAVKREFEAGLRHATTGKLCLSVYELTFIRLWEIFSLTYE